MTDEIVPQWAQKILTDLAVLNSSLPNHISWTERNIDDHEQRLRVVEERVPFNLREQLQGLNQFKWVLVGIAVASGTAGAWVSKALGF